MRDVDSTYVSAAVHWNDVPLGTVVHIVCSLPCAPPPLCSLSGTCRWRRKGQNGDTRRRSQYLSITHTVFITHGLRAA